MNNEELEIIIDFIDKSIQNGDIESLLYIKKYIESKTKTPINDSDKYLFYSINKFCDTFLTQEEKKHFKRRMIIDEIFSILSLNKDDFKTKNKAWYNRVPEDNLGNIFKIYQLLEISDSIEFRLKNTTTLKRLKELLSNVGIPFERLSKGKKILLKEYLDRSEEEYTLKLKNRTF